MSGSATVGTELRDARRRVDAVDARMLLQHVLGLDRAAIMTRADRALSPDETARFASLLERREQGVPVAYLLGHREFYGLEFTVDGSVLIPRPETEGLVDLALERFPDGIAFDVCDLGCGSGAIAIAIAVHRPLASVLGVDASASALATARVNARRLLPETRPGAFELVEGDWLGGLGERRFDLVVSNPPYVREDDPHLGQGDLRFEPRSALASGPDGLADLRRIVADSLGHLNPGGTLAVEHGYDQAVVCRELFAAAGYEGIESRRDLAGIERLTVGVRPR